MSKLYFSKMNINDDIYEVYAGTKKLDELLDKVYLGINNKINIYDEFGGRYKFFDIDKPEKGIMIVTGRLGYIKHGVHSTYDPDTDSAIDIEDKNKIEYITFYFDVFNEMLAFTTTRSLTRKKVLEVFSRLIRKGSEVGTVFVLESNTKELKSELKEMDALKKVILDLVPPNGDKNEFAELFSLDPDKLSEGGATRITQEYSTQNKDGLQKDSELIQSAVDGIALGYAEGKFFGRDKQNKRVEINTSKDVPYTDYIEPHNNKNKEKVSEKGRAGIVNLLVYKAQIREREKGEHRRE